MVPDISRRVYLKVVFPVAITLIIVCLVIARLLWPASAPPYLDAWETISGLGDMEDNLVGFVFFQAAMVVVGLLVLPTALYVHPHLAPYRKGAVGLGTLCMLVGAVGFLLTGFIPDGLVESVDKLHEITSGAGFGGILLASFFYGLAVNKAKAEDQLAQPRVNVIITIMWWVALVLTGLAFGVAELVIKPAYDLGWYGPEWAAAGIHPVVSFAVWERVMFGVGLAYLGLMVLMIRDARPADNA